MTTTISYPGGVTITPHLVLLGSGDVEVESRTITHDILDGAPVHTLRSARPQTGTLRLLFTSSASASAAQGALTAADVYTVASTDDPALNFRMVVRTVIREQSEDAAAVWTVSIEYEAVL